MFFFISYNLFFSFYINKLLIEELRLLLEGAKSTSGHDRFASRAARCEASLIELEERIKILSTVQRKWIYLDPVYGSGAAPSDSGRWSRADKEFRFVIVRICSKNKRRK